MAKIIVLKLKWAGLNNGFLNQDLNLLFLQFAKVTIKQTETLPKRCKQNMLNLEKNVGFLISLTTSQWFVEWLIWHDDLK